jgi:HEPN domain-containing protein
MKKLTAEWVRKAEEDYHVAVRTHRSAGPFHNAVCFHCQQASEKYLKAVLEEQGLTVPKTHDLDDLRQLLLLHDASLRPLRRGLVFLTRFAVETRYPGDWASKRQAAAAIRWVGKVRTTARVLLGLPLGRRARRRKSP